MVYKNSDTDEFSVQIKIPDNAANRAVFKSVSELFKRENENIGSGESAFFENFLEYADENSVRLSNDNKVFMLSEDASSADGVAGFDDNGAIWFSGLRKGKRLDSPESDWAATRDEIAKRYHRKYSVIEYGINADNEDNKNRQKSMLGMMDTIKSIYNKLSGGIIESENFTNNTIMQAKSTYYSLKLKMDVNLGAGEQVPLIGRIYFKVENPADSKHDDKIYPLSRFKAETISNMLNKISGGEGRQSHDQASQTLTSAENTVRYFSDLLKGDKAGKLLTDSILFSDSSIEQLRSQITVSTSEKLCLKCEGITVISVAKIVWPILSCDMLMNGRPVLGVTYDLGGLTVVCKNCAGYLDGGPAVLIEDDEIKLDDFVVNDDLPLRVKISDDIKNAEKLFDGTSAEFCAIRDRSRLARHLIITPDCKRFVPFKGICDRVVCRSICRSFGECTNHADGRGNGVRQDYCFDCPYPEVVSYEGENGRKCLTKDLFFDVNSREMRLSKKNSDGNGTVIARTCRLCGRQFSSKGSAVMFCACCTEAEKLRKGSVATDKYKLLYKKYRRCLSLFRRFMAVFTKNKYCVEDEGLIIFILGKKLYLLNKLLLNRRGYLKPPVKYRGK